jgi:hypothetical protein
MSDTALEEKFRELADDILPPDRIRHVIDLCVRADQLPDAGEIARYSAKA